MQEFNESRFQIHCQLTGKTETFYCYYSKNPLVIIPNGCESSDGSDTCRTCFRRIYEQQLESLR